MKTNRLKDEAAAFDLQIRERIAHGHVPDLRRAQPCDWFYNNPWRRPEYIDSIFGEDFRFALAQIPPGSRNPDLVVLNYGTNESSFAAFLTREYEIELREAIRRVRAALPNASILVMSPMDRGQKNGGEIETLPTIPRIVDIQRRVAAELHCGFFNTFEVMGGAGTMARWYDSQPRLVSADFIHPTPAGARIVATAFVRELTAGLNRYKLRQVLERNAVAEVR